MFNYHAHLSFCTTPLRCKKNIMSIPHGYIRDSFNYNVKNEKGVLGECLDEGILGFPGAAD